MCTDRVGRPSRTPSETSPDTSLGPYMRSTTTDLGVPENGGHSLNRRSLLKAGAHAAWVVPAIQVVGAAPAFASCSKPSANPLSATATAQWRTQTDAAGNWVLDILFTVCDTDCFKSLAGLTISITAPTAWNHLNDHSTSTDWTQSRTKVKGHDLQDNKTYTSNYVVPKNGCYRPFTISVQAQDGKKYSGNLEITVSSQFAGSSTTFTTPVTVRVKA